MDELNLLQCYNTGCLQKYDPNQNSSGACRYHPGKPVFHDALKGWSCCDKRTTDFTTCLEMPGCTYGPHSNIKPVQPEKVKTENPIEISIPEKNKPKELEVFMERPPENEELRPLEFSVADSLKKALEINNTESSNNKEGPKSCKNNGCAVRFIEESSNLQKCVYHSGVPIFHEGLKYWSCCKRKTSDFQEFLKQTGCEEGKHVWFKEGATKAAACRFDFFEAGNDITLNVYAKQSLPEKCEILSNRVVISIKLTFDKGESVFEQKFILKGIIDPERSSVRYTGPKVEIKMRKAEIGPWKCLEKITYS